MILLGHFRLSKFENSALSPTGPENLRTDFTIECLKENKRFYLHKSVLSLQSEVFRRMFDGNFREGQESKMSIKEDDPTTADELEFFLHYLYSPESFSNVLSEFSGPYIKHSGYNGNPLVPYADFLVILDKFLNLGRSFLVDRIKELVQNKILGTKEKDPMVGMFHEEPSLMNAIIFKHELNCTLKRRFFISASILAKLSPMELANPRGTKITVKEQEKEEEKMERVLDHVLCDETSTRKTLRDFGLIHGLISERIKACQSELTDIKRGFSERYDDLASTNERGEVQECMSEDELDQKIRSAENAISDALTLTSPTVDSINCGKWAICSPFFDKTKTLLLYDITERIHRKGRCEEIVNTQILPSYEEESECEEDSD